MHVGTKWSARPLELPGYVTWFLIGKISVPIGRHTIIINTCTYPPCPRFLHT